MSDELRLDWIGELGFRAQTASGHTLQLDASSADGGQNAAPQPMELLLAALAGCAAIDVLSILKKQRQPVEGFSLLVHSQRASTYPKVYTSIEIEYVIQGPRVRPEAVVRAIELTEAKYCPVHAMLAPTVKITHSYRLE